MNVPGILQRKLSLSGWPTVAWLLPFVLTGLAILVAPVPMIGMPQTHYIELDGWQYEFAPGRLRVHQGDTVIMILRASDVVHGFYLEGYDIERRLTPGIAERVEFVANRRGKFRFRCSVSCGPLHPFMIGELIVTPNVPFWRAAAVTVVALAGLISYLHRQGANDRSSL